MALASLPQKAGCSLLSDVLSPFKNTVLILGKEVISLMGNRLPFQHFSPCWVLK